jgi:hypothetical protein
MLQQELHERENENVEHVRAACMADCERITAALKLQHNTLMDRMQEELESLRKRGVLLNMM